MSQRHSSYTKSLGTLFTNSNRNKDKSPQLLGEMKIQPNHLKQLLVQHQQQSSEEPVVAKLAAWKYQSEKGAYLVLEIQPEYKRRESYSSSDEFQSLLDFTDE